MRRSFRYTAVALAAVITLATATFVIAQQGPPDTPPGQGAGMGLGPMGAGPMGEGLGGFGSLNHLLRMCRTVSDLGITDQQLQQIQTIVDQSKPQIDAIMDKIRAGRDEFFQNNDPAVFNEAAVRQFAAEQGSLHADLMVEMARSRAAALSVLTPEQRTKLEQLKNAPRERLGKHHHGRGGPQKNQPK